MRPNNLKEVIKCTCGETHNIFEWDEPGDFECDCGETYNAENYLPEPPDPSDAIKDAKIERSFENPINTQEVIP